LQKGFQIEIQELANKLTLLGYTKDNVTSTEGFWSRRGEIIDIYPVNNEFPIRLEFFDNVIEKIREYDPHSQKTLESINNIEIIQAGFDLLIKDKLNNLSKNSIFNSEDINKNNLDRYLGIIEKEPSNIIDFINRETILVIDELEDCKKFANNWYLDSESNFDNCANELNENLKNNGINLEAKTNLHLKFDEILNSIGNFNLIKFYEFESKVNIDNRFLLNDKRLNSYSKDISSPEKSFDSCSRLSPYICWGCLSLKEIFYQANLYKNNNSRMLKSRLTWHCHFIQKLESEPELEFQDFHPYFQNIRTNKTKLLVLWSQGNTGFPFIDACMRSLNFNGWINFRMRAMLMSFASYNLWLPWQDSGSELAKKFIDYEPGIHWNQCQMQSGTTSINTNRIYNPIKQGKDHDPKGEFIKKWVPELKKVTDTFIHEPWLLSKFNNEEYSKLEYIKPIVDISKTSREAREKIQEITQKKGYWDISKKIYLKHGSRKKTVINKRPKKSNNKKQIQYELNLRI